MLPALRSVKTQRNHVKHGYGNQSCVGLALGTLARQGL